MRATIRDLKINRKDAPASSAATERAARRRDLIYSRTYSLTHLLAHLLTHLLAHLLTHFLPNLLTHFLHYLGEGVVRTPQATAIQGVTAKPAVSRASGKSQKVTVANEVQPGLVGGSGIPAPNGRFAT